MKRILLSAIALALLSGLTAQELSFEQGVDHNIQGKFNGGVALGDFNEDGFLDVVTMGATHYVMTPEPFTEVIRTHLHLNNGNRGFTATTPFEHLAGGQPIVADFNNDGHEDVFISGYKISKTFNSENYVSLLYLGNGDGTFVENEITFPWGPAFLRGYGRDLDNDGNMDIVFQIGDPDGAPYGYETDGEVEVRVVRGNGDGTFSEVSTALPDFSLGTSFAAHNIIFADIDNNGYDDVILGGDLEATRLFLNQGNFVFEEVVNPVKVGSHMSPFPETLNVFFSFGYINDDDYLDLVVSDNGLVGKTYFYLNNGDATFTESQRFDYSLNTVYFHDFDNDGLSELFSGWGPVSHEGSRLFLNDDGVYHIDNSFELWPWIIYGTSIAADFDNDGDDDLLYIGRKFMTDYAGASMYWNNLITMGTHDVVETTTQIYPNPTNNIINVTNPKNGVNVLNVFSSNGQLVKAVNFGNEENIIMNVNDLPKGVYIIKIGNLSSKFIKD